MLPLFLIYVDYIPRAAESFLLLCADDSYLVFKQDIGWIDKKPNIVFIKIFDLFIDNNASTYLEQDTTLTPGELWRLYDIFVDIRG